jgi:hypothetical protein
LLFAGRFLWSSRVDRNWRGAGKNRPNRQAKKCSIKVKKSVDGHLDLCNSERTHGKHKLHKEKKMRTLKGLLCAAALVAGVATSMAQSNVYSLNVVGYVNLPVTAGSAYLIGNPLTGGDNTAATILTNMVSVGGLPTDWNGSTVYEFDNAAGYVNADVWTYNPTFSLFGWGAGGSGNGPNGFTDITPGKGFWFLPTASGTVTFVGQVMTNNTFSLPHANGGVSLVSSAFPATNSLVSIGMFGNPGDNVYRWDPVAGWWDTPTYNAAIPLFNIPQGWNEPDTNGPVLSVGEAVFYQNTQTTNENFVQNFTIQ